MTNICNNNTISSIPSLNTAITKATTNPLKPAKAIKISSTQILRLNSNLSSTVSSVSIKQSNTITQTTTSQSLNQTTNNLVNSGLPSQTSNSTIVKLTAPPQINVNSLNKATTTISSPTATNNSDPSISTICNGTSIISSTTNPIGNIGTQFQLYNPNSSNQLKHFVQLPKSAQKLIILPTNSSQIPFQNNNLKPNILSGPQSSSILSPTVLENSDLKVINPNSAYKDQPSVTQINTLPTTASVQKLILCKNLNSDNNLLNNSANLVSNMNGSNGGQTTKSVKIVSTSVLNQGNTVSAASTSPSLTNNKPIVFNVSSGLQKANIINKLNISFANPSLSTSTNQVNRSKAFMQTIYSFFLINL